MQGIILRDALWWAGAALDAILALRLWEQRLARRYPVVAVYLCFDALFRATTGYLGSGQKWLSGAFVRVFVATQPVRWVLYFLVILELYSLILEEFPGIRRLGRLAMLSALSAVALVCCVVIAFEPRAVSDPQPWLSFLVVQQRSVFFALSALALLLLLFVAHYRLSISRNVWILYVSLCGYFLTNAFLYTLRRYFGPTFSSSRDLLGLLAYFVALVGATLFVSEAGEMEKRPISAMWGRRNPELEVALSSQLQSFNQVLLKVLRQ